MNTKTLVMADAVAIKNQVSLSRAFRRMWTIRFRLSTAIRIGTPLIVRFRQNTSTSNAVVDEGAVFSQDDVDRAADVCAIGEPCANNFWRGGVENQRTSLLQAVGGYYFHASTQKVVRARFARWRRRPPPIYIVTVKIPRPHPRTSVDVEVFWRNATIRGVFNLMP